MTSSPSAARIEAVTTRRPRSCDDANHDDFSVARDRPIVKGVRAIVGTAGHIDHGKSALVRALTGIEPDRLPEERERGISIELGFAHLDLPAIGRIGVVDVPGHERFIRQMLAGAHGFDLVLVVVAADDGVMPQTEEHFDIVHLLAVQRAIFVISKIDAVPAARVDEVRGEIEILAVGTRFEGAPVVAVSARDGDGLETLRTYIAAALSDLQPRSEEGLLRVPVDRVFVVRGHGVVVTGTALAGRVAAGDEVVILPSARSVRVREVQVHGETVDAAFAGQRVALNLSGIDKDDVSRGDTVTVAGGPAATSRLDARVEIRPAAGRPVASHVRVRVHHGTRESLARLVWLDGVREVAPRGSGYAQLALAEPLVAAAGDRFIVRDETASRTIGGGVVLLARAERHRRSRGDVSPTLQMLEHGDDAARLHTVLAMAPVPALEPDDAALAVGLPVTALAALVASDPRVVALPDAGPAQVLIAAERLDDCLAGLRAAIADFQAKNPNLPGIDLERLRGAARPVPDAKLFRLLVDRLLAAGVIEKRGNIVHTRGHAASLAGTDDVLASRMQARIAGAGAMPPMIRDLADELAVDVARVSKVAAVLVLRGDLVRVSGELFFSRAAIDEIRARLVEHLGHEGEISAAGFRDLIAASRKYCIPLLDWFDRAGLTIRVGDVRRLRRT